MAQEVQTTKTGFALCPSSPDAIIALEAHKKAISDFGGRQVESNSHWVPYRVTNVPRSVGRIAADNTYSLVPVNFQAIIQAVTESIGHSPVSVTETSSSVTNPYHPYTSWFVNFPEGTPTTLHCHLQLFGVGAAARSLPQKTTVIQCSRC
jgi:hypothetical protein